MNPSVKDFGDVSRTALCFWRFLNLFMSIFFMVATGLQYNDPDPMVWMFLYGFSSIICITIVINPYVQERRLWRMLVTVHLLYTVGLLVYAILAYGHLVVKNLNILHDEEGRELCGLSLVAIWLSISMATSFGTVHPMGMFSWCVIGLCAMVPLLGTLLLYVTIDPSILPHHCKGIIQGMQNITRQFYKKNAKPFYKIH